MSLKTVHKLLISELHLQLHLRFLVLREITLEVRISEIKTQRTSLINKSIRNLKFNFKVLVEIKCSWA
jgi:hypothetical protein